VISRWRSTLHRRPAPWQETSQADCQPSEIELLGFRLLSARKRKRRLKPGFGNTAPQEAVRYSVASTDGSKKQKDPGKTRVLSLIVGETGYSTLSIGSRPTIEA
jgi:hypothetical protein